MEWTSREGTTTSRSTWREGDAVFPFEASSKQSREGIDSRRMHLSTGHGGGGEVSGLETQDGFQDEKASIRVGEIVELVFGFI